MWAAFVGFNGNDSLLGEGYFCQGKTVQILSISCAIMYFKVYITSSVCCLNFSISQRCEP